VEGESVKSILGILAASAALLAAPLSAQTSGDHASHHPDPKATTTAATLSEGEVRRVDKSAGKVTIKHGPLANLDMPSMTMVFRVKDPAMLDQVKEGDKIKFNAEKIDGALTVTEMQVNN
jgi:Cu(I)/Ag(I) efflux system periplasmic protein CusF